MPGKPQAVGPEGGVAYAQPSPPYIPNTSEGFQALLAALAQMANKNERRRELKSEEAMKLRLMEKEFNLRKEEDKNRFGLEKEKATWADDFNNPINRALRMSNTLQKQGLVPQADSAKEAMANLQKYWQDLKNNAEAPMRKAQYAASQLQSLTQVTKQYFLQEMRNAGAIQDTQIMQKWASDAKEAEKDIARIANLQKIGFTAGAKDGTQRMISLLNEGKGQAAAPATTTPGGPSSVLGKVATWGASEIAKTLDDLGALNEPAQQAFQTKPLDLFAGMKMTPEGQRLADKANTVAKGGKATPEPAGARTSQPSGDEYRPGMLSGGVAQPTPGVSQPWDEQRLTKYRRVVDQGLLAGLDPSYSKLAWLAAQHGFISGRQPKDLQADMGEIAKNVDGDAAVFLHSRILGAMKLLGGAIDQNAAPPNVGSIAGDEGTKKTQEWLAANRTAGLDNTTRTEMLTYLSSMERALRPVASFTLDKANTQQLEGKLMEQAIASGKLEPSDLVNSVMTGVMKLNAAQIALQAELNGDTESDHYQKFVAALPQNLRQEVTSGAKTLADLFQKGDIAREAGRELRQAGMTDEQISKIQSRIINAKITADQVGKVATEIRSANLTPDDAMKAWQGGLKQFEAFKLPQGFVGPPNVQSEQEILGLAGEVIGETDDSLQQDYELEPTATSQPAVGSAGKPSLTMADLEAMAGEMLDTNANRLGSELINANVKSLPDDPVLGSFDKMFSDMDNQASPFSTSVWKNRDYSTVVENSVGPMFDQVKQMQGGPPPPTKPPTNPQQGQPAPAQPGVSRANPAAQPVQPVAAVQPAVQPAVAPPQLQQFQQPAPGFQQGPAFAANPQQQAAFG